MNDYLCSKVNHFFVLLLTRQKQLFFFFLHHTLKFKLIKKKKKKLPKTLLQPSCCTNNTVACHWKLLRRDNEHQYAKSVKCPEIFLSTEILKPPHYDQFLTKNQRILRNFVVNIRNLYLAYCLLNRKGLEYMVAIHRCKENAV